MSYFRKLSLTVVYMNVLTYTKEVINSSNKVLWKFKNLMDVFKRNLYKRMYINKDIVY